MKRLFLGAVALVLALNAMAAKDPKWQDPNFFEENRLPMRSTFIVTPTAEEAVAEHDFSKSPLYRSIGGVWNFYWRGFRQRQRYRNCGREINASLLL